MAQGFFSQLSDVVFLPTIVHFLPQIYPIYTCVDPYSEYGSVTKFLTTGPICIRNHKTDFVTFFAGTSFGTVKLSFFLPLSAFARTHFTEH